MRFLPGSCRRNRPAAGRFLPVPRQEPRQLPPREAERFLPRGRTVPASRPNGSCPAGRFLPRQTVPAKRRFEIENCKFPYNSISSLQTRRTTRREQVARLSNTGRWALALRPEHHPRSDQSGHVEQPACRIHCPKEPHAQRSWHLQRSWRICHQKCGCRLSPTTSTSGAPLLYRLRRAIPIARAPRPRKS